MITVVLQRRTESSLRTGCGTLVLLPRSGAMTSRTRCRHDGLHYRRIQFRIVRRAAARLSLRCRVISRFHSPRGRLIYAGVGIPGKTSCGPKVEQLCCQPDIACARSTGMVAGSCFYVTTWD